MFLQVSLCWKNSMLADTGGDNTRAPAIIHVNQLSMEKITSVHKIGTNMVWQYCLNQVRQDWVDTTWSQNLPITQHCVTIRGGLYFHSFTRCGIYNAEHEIQNELLLSDSKYNKTSLCPIFRRKSLTMTAVPEALWTRRGQGLRAAMAMM